MGVELTAGPDQPRPVGKPPSNAGRLRSSLSSESTAKEGTTSFTESYSMTRDELKKWIEVQIPYENLAGNADVAERALHFAREYRSKFRSIISPIREKWRVILQILRGHSLARQLFEDSTVHVPELYKMMETLVPRIEEAVLGFGDEWFSVRGREQQDRLVEQKIAAFLRYQLYHDRFSEKVQPIIRTMLTYAFAAGKVYWDYEIEERVKRIVERDTNGTKIKYRITRELVEEVVYNGPTMKLIDPLDFIIDPKCTDVSKAMYVGDTCVMTLDEIANLCDLGVYQNLALVEEIANQKNPLDQYFKGARAQVYANSLLDNNIIEGGPKRVEVTELWCRFDIYGTGRTKECVITVANDAVVLRVQENPYDDKHRPYAIARAAMEPFDFFNTGPLDNAVRLQIEMDEHRTLALEAHRLSLCPLTFIPEGSDVPDSLLNIQPGSVFRTPTPPTFLQVRSVANEMLSMDEITRRDIEETVGAPRILEGTGSENTATEVERKLQESNRRIRGLVRAVSRMFEDMLRIMHSLNSQYVTRRETFRVLGKAAVGLYQYEEVGPEVFNQSIDFEFLSAHNIHTIGQQATSLQQALTIMYPFIQAFPDVIDVPAALKELVRLTVSSKLAEEIVHPPQRLDDMLDPLIENELLLQGQRLPVHEMDDDRDHYAKHMRLTMSPEFKRLHPEVKTETHKHIAMHVSQESTKRLQEQAAAKRQSPAVVPGQNPEIDKDRGTTGARQNSIGSGQSPAQSPGGEARGSARPQAIGAPDNGSPAFQTSNMGTSGL